MLVFVLSAVAACLVLLVASASRRRPPPHDPAPAAQPRPAHVREPHPAPYRPATKPREIRGRCYVIDGDTIVIGSTHIRLAGIDAPELDQPYGRKAKWAMFHLCKGQTVTAVLTGETSYDRLVGTCYLPDGRDLGAELIKQGLALDWEMFSGGKYRDLEPPGVRRRLRAIAHFARLEAERAGRG